jgi:NodT family efflux transporter outer membrane factor (OMF) lipoprotein
MKTPSAAALALTGLALTALVLAGCMVGPDFHTPAAPGVGGFTARPTDAGPAMRLTEGADVPGRWWTVYRSPALDALVDQALKANPDAEAAQAALRSARESYYAQKGALWPTVDASYSANRQKTSDTLASPLSNNSELFTLHTLQVTVGYTPDVFGGLRRQAETAKAQADAQRFQTEATYLTLTSNLVAAAIQEAMLRDQVEATRALIKSGCEVLDIMRRQLAAGEIAGADLAAQETAVAQAEQTLPPLEKQLAQTQDQIADLTGRYPSEVGDDGLHLSGLALPADLPLSLPSRLVEQRPDIRAAEANLHAASAQVGVAVAARLPGFTLTAQAGGQASDLARMFSNGNGFWSLTGEVAQPIFQGGALLHRQHAAEAAFDQAKAQYRSTVLSAFQNVADTLQALQADGRALQAADAAQASADKSLAIARRQFSEGEVGAIVVLNAEQAYQQAVVSRLQADAGRYADSAALFQALGGGWWNRDETAAVK